MDRIMEKIKLAYNPIVNTGISAYAGFCRSGQADLVLIL